MATTVNDLIRAAIATSRHNVRGGTASDEELVALIGDLLEGYFGEGALVNRRFFAGRITVDYDSSLGGWPRPSGATTVVHLVAGEGMQTATGQAIALETEIVDLAFEQRTTELGRPAVYQWGQVWYPAGRGTDPAAGKLVVFAGMRPTLPAATEDTIDPLWPEAHNPLLKWNLAIYLAQKDGERQDEVDLFTRLRDEAYGRFIAFLKGESLTEVRDYGFGNSFPDPGVKPR